MPRGIRNCVVCVVMLLTACASNGGHQSVLVDPDFTARPGHTWAWQPADPKGRDNLDARIDNDIVMRSLERAIRAALNGRGLYEAIDQNNADLHVAFRIGLTKRTELREGPEPVMVRQRVVCGPRGCIPVLSNWGWYGPPTPAPRPVEYFEGGLMVDIMDANSGRLVWRGTIKDRVQIDGMPPQSKVDQAVFRLIDRVPVSDQ